MRKKGSGTVYYDKANECWVARYPVGTGKNGRTVYKTKRASSKKDAMALLRELEAAFRRDELVPGPRETLKNFALWYLESAASQRLKPNTRTKYLSDLARYVFPRLGAVPLTEIKPEELIDLFEELQIDLGLSAATVNGVRKVISAIFTRAIRLGKCRINPVAMTDRVQPLAGEKPHVMEPWTQEESIRALKAVRDSSLDAVLHLALCCGLRLGEILGLHWEDVDYQKGLLWVNSTLSETTFVGPTGKGKTELIIGDPKSKSSRRPVPLNRMTMEALQRHGASQIDLRMRARDRDQWTDSGLVFTNSTGDPVYPSNVRNRFQTFCRANGIRYIRPHDLRHTFAVLALEQGQALAGVAQMLGHESMDFTKRVYAKYVHSLSEEVSEALQSALNPDGELRGIRNREVMTTYRDNS